jgi:hypothetical protein
MKHVTFLIFVVVWTAMCAGIVFVVERFFEGRGYRSAPLGEEPGDRTPPVA